MYSSAEENLSMDQFLAFLEQDINTDPHFEFHFTILPKEPKTNVLDEFVLEVIEGKNDDSSSYTVISLLRRMKPL